MQKLVAGIALGVVILANGLIGCDSVSIANKVLQNKETPDAWIRQEVPHPATAQAASSTPFTALEQSIHQQINQYRQSRKLPSLTLDPHISEQARAHSQAMASGRVPFSHQGFDQRIKAISKVISYRGVAENVAYNQGYGNPDRQAVQGWLKSEGHRTNIQGQYNLTGIGIAKNVKGEYYFTQIFLRTR